MLFMVIEEFRDGKVPSIAERFCNRGRMLPEGVVYVNSWIDSYAGRCFQVIESPNPELVLK